MKSLALDEAISNVVPGPSHVAARTKAASTERARIEKWLRDKIAAGRSVEITTITQVMAETLLALNTRNRPLAESNLDALIKDATSGRFVFNGESVVISEAGILLDGQHRLLSVLKSGVAIETVIVFGVPDEARGTIDIGKTRNAGNLLSIEYDVEDSGTLATTIAFILQWKALNRLATSSKERPTKTQIKEALAQFDGVSESVAFCKDKVASSKAKPPASLAILAFCHWAFKQRTDEVAADTFMGRMITGLGGKESDPIIYVRDRLAGTKHRAGYRVSLMFKAWNLWRTGSAFEQIHATKFLPHLEG